LKLHNYSYGDIEDFIERYRDINEPESDERMLHKYLAKSVDEKTLKSILEDLVLEYFGKDSVWYVN
jgi:hypothetical protein